MKCLTGISKPGLHMLLACGLLLSACQRNTPPAPEPSSTSSAGAEKAVLQQIRVKTKKPGEPLDVVFLTPRADKFWSYASLVAQAAAKDLNIRLRVMSAFYKPEKYLADAKSVLNAKDKPDAILFKNYNDLGPQIIELAEKAQVPAIGVEEGLSSEVEKEFGKPREKYAYWIGEVLNDHEESGAILVRGLLEQARRQKLEPHNKRYQMGAIYGTPPEGSAIFRFNGAQAEVQSRSDVLLLPPQAAYWLSPMGYQRMQNLLRRYPKTQAIWVPNDGMALGAAQAARELGYQPGKDLLIGCTGAIPEGAQALYQGDVSVTVGGHFMPPALALVLVYDYYHGNDFAVESTQFRTHLQLYTTETIKPYYRQLGESKWDEIDFRQLSKVLNKKRLTYDFSMQNVLRHKE